MEHCHRTVRPSCSQVRSFQGKLWLGASCKFVRRATFIRLGDGGMRPSCTEPVQGATALGELRGDVSQGVTPGIRFVGLTDHSSQHLSLPGNAALHCMEWEWDKAEPSTECRDSPQPDFPSPFPWRDLTGHLYTWPHCFPEEKGI